MACRSARRVLPRPALAHNSIASSDEQFGDASTVQRRGLERGAIEGHEVANGGHPAERFDNEPGHGVRRAFVKPHPRRFLEVLKVRALIDDAALRREIEGGAISVVFVDDDGDLLALPRIIVNVGSTPAIAGR